MNLASVMTALMLTAGMGNPATRALSPGKPSTLEAVWQGTRVAVTIWTKKERTKDVVWDETWPGQFPSSLLVIKRITIVVGGKKLFVPGSAYADLLDVREGSLVVGDGGPVLTLRGGDGAESYYAQVLFDRTAVRKRLLYSAEFPAKPGQETLYYYETIE